MVKESARGGFGPPFKFNYYLRVALILLGLFFYFLPLFSLPAKGEAIYDLNYLIIDRTKTPWGHKFARTFQEIWEPPKGLKGYFITIGERKVSFKQSWIYVKVGDNIFNYEVYTSLLKPTTSDFDMQVKALKASKRVLMFLLKNYFRLKSLENEL
ncbi:CsgE family curli-type amyloid fiber assembly protein [Thermovibrio sp.]